MTNVPSSAEEMAKEKKEASDFDPSRVSSLDAFRGLAIIGLLVILGLPAGLDQVLPGLSKITIYDVMFPLFLLIVGMSIPIAVVHRIDGGDGAVAVFKHMIIRNLGLLIMGVFMANYAAYHESSSLPRDLWMTLFYVGAILVWLHYPKIGKRRFVFAVLRLGGILILAYLNISFRGGDGGENMQARGWGALGLLGWAGLLAGALYLVLKQNFSAMIGAATMLTLVSITHHSGQLELEGIPAMMVGNGSIFTHALIVVLGILPGMLFTGEGHFSDDFRNRFLYVAAVFMIASGWLTSQMYAFSRIDATPAWGLYTSAAGYLVFALVYFIVEVKKISIGLRFLERTGRNSLMAFLLWGFVSQLAAFLGISFLAGGEKGSMIGSLIIAVIVLGAAAYLSKLKIRMKL